MNTKTFKLNSLYTAIALATSASVYSANAVAEGTNADADVEVIEVRGIRSALTKSAQTKRDSDGVVDAITAEDIGKLPDTNLAESLQRITGVSIDRANNEGNKVTVRGFGPDFNLVTLNGRQMPNSSALQSEGVSRSFNFREIAADSVSSVNVYKTGRSNVSSGGIGATIDIQTARPFDFQEFTAFATAKAIVDTSVEKGDSVTPELSGMVTNTFLDGNLGLLLSASISERHSHRDVVGTDGWVRNRSADNVDKSAINTAVNPTQAIWTPWTARVEHYDTERERVNAQAVIQYQLAENLIATADYTVSTLEEVSQTNRMAFWFDNPSGSANENGTLYNPRDPDDELNFWAWEYYEEKDNDSLGINLEWQVSESLQFTLDYHDSTSHSNPDGQTAETLANLKNPSGSVALIGADFVGDIPAIIVDDSNLASGGYAKANIVSDLYQKRGYEMENNISQIQLAGRWENLDSDSSLTYINFGVSQTDYTVDTYLSEVFSFVDVPLTNLDIDFIALGDTADQFSGTNQLFPLIPQYSVHQFIDIVKDNGNFNDPNISINGVEEETTAVYVSVDLDTEFNSMPVKLNAGVRYESTDVVGYSVQNGIVAMNYRHVQELRPVLADEPTSQRLEGSYTRVLPNLDFSLNVTDEVVTRFSYSRTLARAGISAMFPATNVDARPGGPFSATQGNPNLLPITSDNFDLSLEWYLDDGSYASIGYFKKFVENFIGAGTENRTIDDINGNPLTDPSVSPRPGCPDASDTPNPDCLGTASDPVITWEVATPDNIQNREVDGWELNLQYMFANTGFGAIANYTLVDSDESFDPYNFDQTIALTGLSDSGNLVAFYEEESWQARIAYNWRDDFLLSLGNEPTFTEAYGQIDVSVSYNVSDNLTVTLDGLNITDETVRRHGRFKEQLLSAEQYGPRFNLGASYKF